MKQLTTNINKDHKELSPLLPWYVNKSLHDAELKAVENHISACLTCKRELIQLAKLAHAVRHESALDSTENASFARLKMRLHGQETATSTRRQPPVSENVTPINTKNRPAAYNWYRPALAMAAAVLLTVTFIMPISIDIPGSNDFRTLSNGETEKAVKANEIRVVFADNIGMPQKNAILSRINGQIVEAPTAQGVYTVRLESSVDAKHTLAVIDTLRKDSGVIFAEPAYALLSSMHTDE